MNKSAYQLEPHITKASLEDVNVCVIEALLELKHTFVEFNKQLHSEYPDFAAEERGVHSCIGFISALIERKQGEINGFL